MINSDESDEEESDEESDDLESGEESDKEESGEESDKEISIEGSVTKLHPKAHSDKNTNENSIRDSFVAKKKKTRPQIASDED